MLAYGIWVFDPLAFFIFRFVAKPLCWRVRVVFGCFGPFALFTSDQLRMCFAGACFWRICLMAPFPFSIYFRAYFCRLLGSFVSFDPHNKRR